MGRFSNQHSRISRVPAAYRDCPDSEGFGVIVENAQYLCHDLLLSSAVSALFAIDGLVVVKRVVGIAPRIVVVKRLAIIDVERQPELNTSW
jgi:hypothetical protein